MIQKDLGLWGKTWVQTTNPRTMPVPPGKQPRQGIQHRKQTESAVKMMDELQGRTEMTGHPDTSDCHTQGGAGVT